MPHRSQGPGFGFGVRCLTPKAMVSGCFRCFREAWVVNYLSRPGRFDTTSFSYLTAPKLGSHVQNAVQRACYEPARVVHSQSVDPRAGAACRTPFIFRGSWWFISGEYLGLVPDRCQLCAVHSYGDGWHLWSLGWFGRHLGLELGFLAVASRIRAGRLALVKPIATLQFCH